MRLDSFVIPGLLAALAILALRRKVDLYGALTRGASQGLHVLLRIFPALVGLLTAIAMFRASGAMEFLTTLCTPLLEKLGIPAETAPLICIRPISGSGALAVVSDLIRVYGPDSYVGRVAAVMMGSTETTFYTTAVYFSASEIRETRYTIPAALTADAVGFFMAALTTRLLSGR